MEVVEVSSDVLKHTRELIDELGLLRRFTSSRRTSQVTHQLFVNLGWSCRETVRLKNQKVRLTPAQTNNRHLSHKSCFTQGCSVSVQVMEEIVTRVSPELELAELEHLLLLAGLTGGTTSTLAPDKSHGCMISSRGRGRTTGGGVKCSS